MTSPRTRGFALALAGSVAALALAGCGDDEPTSVSDDPSPSEETTSEAPPPTEETTSAAPSPSESTPAEKATVPLYFVGQTPQGTRLFREFRSVEGDPVTEAAALVTSGEPTDPDYDSLYPGGNFETVRYLESAREFEVVLADDSWTDRLSGMSRAEARLAVQQLVYTVQGAAQTRDPVKVYAEQGSAATTLFGIDTSRGLKAAPQLDVLGLVNVTTPAEGETVSGSFTAKGVASSFEATVPWQIRRGGPDGEVVLDGFSTAEGWIDRLYPWEAEVDVSGLDPGQYSFVALTDDPSGGEGGGPTEDSKSITIE